MRSRCVSEIIHRINFNVFLRRQAALAALHQDALRMRGSHHVRGWMHPLQLLALDHPQAGVGPLGFSLGFPLVQV